MTVLTKAKSAKHVLREINCPHLNLYKGDGYWYFEYDNLAKSPLLYDTYSVYTMRLSDLALERWVEEGKMFVSVMEDKS